MASPNNPFGIFVPEEAPVPEGPPPALEVGARYKAYYRNSVDRYGFIGTFAGVAPGNYLKFTDVVMENGSRTNSLNLVVHQEYTFMPVAAGGKRRKSRRANKRSRRGTRKYRTRRHR